MKRKLHLKALLIAALFSAFANLIIAQETASPAATATGESQASPPPPENITLTTVTDLALRTQRLLEQVRAISEVPAEIITIKASLPESEKQVKNQNNNTLKLLDDKKASAEQIRNNQTEWKYIRDQMNQQFQAARNYTSAIEGALAQLAQEEATWENLKLQLDNSSPQEARKAIEKSLSDINTTRKLLNVPLKDTLAMANQWLLLMESTDETLLTLKQREKNTRRDLLTNFESPIWKMESKDFQPDQTAYITIQQQIKFSGHYLNQHPIFNAVIILTVIGIFLLLWRLRSRSDTSRLLDQGKHLRFALLSRPFSTNIGTSTTLALVLYQNVPPLLQLCLTLLLFIPVVRLGLPLIARSLHALVWSISLLYIVNNFSVLTELIPGAHRLSLVFCSMFSAVIFYHALRQLERSTASTSFFWKTLRPTAWVCIGVSLLATLSGTLGASTLAQFLILGIINASYAALCLTVVAGILGDLAIAALYLPSLDASYLIRRNRHLLSGKFRTYTTLAGALAWIYFVLQQFFLDDAFWQILDAIRTSGFTVGNLSVTIGSIFAIVITIWLSLKVSQLIRFVLIEDIAPRSGMARGVPEAVASLSHYSIILIGFLLAISAAGIDMSKIAIMAGALGVGIGIGLQDVVNNFTAGLILLFEQNIKQGDIIQCSTINGEVLQIGLRSSIVRTFDGAEVILPNSQLVSAQVSNWTHSDQERRISIPIGASYGTDPQLVIDTLIAVAKADPDVLAEPAPAAFFFRFGASSMEFELRAWVARGDILNDVTSRLCVGITEAFTRAGIQIPFPQQDVFIKNLGNGDSNTLKPP